MQSTPSSRPGPARTERQDGIEEAAPGIGKYRRTVIAGDNPKEEGHGDDDLPDDLAAKITIHYYLDARDALLKALAV